MTIRINQDDQDDQDVEFLQCPKCEGENIEWKGGDSYMQLGRNGGLMRVDWFKCADCAHDFSITEPR